MSYLIESYRGPLRTELLKRQKRPGSAPAELVVEVVRKNFGMTIDPEEQKPSLMARQYPLWISWLEDVPRDHEQPRQKPKRAKMSMLELTAKPGTRRVARQESGTATFLMSRRSREPRCVSLR